MNRPLTLAIICFLVALAIAFYAFAGEKEDLQSQLSNAQGWIAACDQIAHSVQAEKAIAQQEMQRIANRLKELEAKEQEKK